MAGSACGLKHCVSGPLRDLKVANQRKGRGAYTAIIPTVAVAETHVTATVEMIPCLTNQSKRMKFNHQFRLGLRIREALVILLNRLFFLLPRESRPARLILSLMGGLDIKRELVDAADYLRRFGASGKDNRFTLDRARPLRCWSDIRHNYDEWETSFSATSIWEENGRVFVRTTENEIIHLTDRIAFNPDERYWEGECFCEDDLYDFIAQAIDDLPF